MKPTIYTAADLLASFYAASCVADASQSALILTPASAAGMLLHLHCDPRTALGAASKMPSDVTWLVAASYLRELAHSGVVETACRVEMGVIAEGGE